MNANMDGTGVCFTKTTYPHVRHNADSVKIPAPDFKQLRKTLHATLLWQPTWRLTICDLVTFEDAVINGSGFRRRRAVEADEPGSRKEWEPGSTSGREVISLPNSQGKRFFMNDSGRIGVGDTDIMVDDVVSVLIGGKMPFILRQAVKKDGGTFHQLVGQAYVHGIMDGEVTREGRDVEWVNLI